MDLNWLDDFVALAEHRNFSRAAEERHVTQPAFSRRIQSLEAWIGAPLLRRSPHAVTLTAAGESLLSRAADITRDLRQARRSALKAAGREQAALTIAATHALSFTFFPGWVRKVAPLEALGTLNLVSDTMAACERILLAGDADFLLCHHHPGLAERFETARFAYVVVGTDHLVPVSAVDASGAALFDLPDAASPPVRYLAYSASSGLGRILEQAGCAPSKDLPLDTTFTSPLAAALQTMARQGHGIAWLPRSLAQDDISAGRLVCVGNERFRVPVQIRLYRAHDQRPGLSERFWQTVSRGGVSDGSC